MIFNFVSITRLSSAVVFPPILPPAKLELGCFPTWLPDDGFTEPGPDDTATASPCPPRFPVFMPPVVSIVSICPISLIDLIAPPAATIGEYCYFMSTRHQQINEKTFYLSSNSKCSMSKSIKQDYIQDNTF